MMMIIITTPEEEEGEGRYDIHLAHGGCVVAMGQVCFWKEKNISIGE